VPAVPLLYNLLQRRVWAWWESVTFVPTGMPQLLASAYKNAHPARVFFAA